MGSLLSYSGLSTKIRAMQSKLIRESQYQEISQMDSVTQVVAYLKKQPGFSDLWADLDENSLHRGDIESFWFIPYIRILPNCTALPTRSRELSWPCI